MSRLSGSLAGLVALVASALFNASAAEPPNVDAARWNPLHFQPAIAQATNDQCLACHREVLDARPLARSPAGLEASRSLAWYQTLDTYAGPQETMHRRHLVLPYAKRVMDLRCNTCHQGHDPREQSPAHGDGTKASFTLRKTVDPRTCLLCHGQFPNQVMGLPDAWPKVAGTFANNCLTCHVAIRTTRHQVNYLRPAEIEKAGTETGDACYGCHGGRAWYRIAYPYARHAWNGMAPDVPEWAKDRPTESAPRFRHP
ncbi:MAG: hypothetical protein U1F52_10145 [Burkholderiales bacterium]